MDRNTLLQNKLTHSHKTSRKFGAKKYGRGGEGGWSRHDQPQALPTLSSSQSFRITLARREESVSTFKAPASPPLPPLRKGGKGIVAPFRGGKALLPRDVSPSRAGKTRVSKPSLQLAEHPLFITPRWGSLPWSLVHLMLGVLPKITCLLSLLLSRSAITSDQGHEFRFDFPRARQRAGDSRSRPLLRQPLLSEHTPHFARCHFFFPGCEFRVVGEPSATSVPVGSHRHDSHLLRAQVIEQIRRVGRGQHLQAGVFLKDLPDHFDQL